MSSVRSKGEYCRTPSAALVSELVQKRGWEAQEGGRKRRLTDNAAVEERLGESGLICLEDVVHEVTTVGDAFREATNFLAPFSLSNPAGGWTKKSLSFAQGGEFGDRAHQIDNLLKRMI